MSPNARDEVWRELVAIYCETALLRTRHVAYVVSLPAKNPSSGEDLVTGNRRRPSIPRNTT